MKPAARKECGSRRIAVWLMAGLMILTLGATVGCFWTHPIKDPPVPAFLFEIEFPSGEIEARTLSIQRGTSVILPVTVQSYCDVPISVRLRIDRQPGFPEDIYVSLPDGYQPLPAGDNISLSIRFNVSGDTPPGTYHTMLMGDLLEEVPGQPGSIAGSIDLAITENPPGTGAIELPRKFLPAYFIEPHFPADEP
ncbi:MAG: hypothetical protein MUO19_01625, partial [Dehalococcoidales bacterium]|nr:hypothetical protein [Dehalococcoidales bacterium]